MLKNNTKVYWHLFLIVSWRSSPEMGIQKNIPKELLNKKRLLVVEDNLLNQKIAAHLIKQFGFSCSVCTNGKQAIDLLSSGAYDLVLMDIQMPEMDGYEATRYIRKQLHLNIPVIATSGNSSGAEKSKCIENGMNDYITKPLKSDELFNILTKYLFPDFIFINK